MSRRKEILSVPRRRQRAPLAERFGRKVKRGSGDKCDLWLGVRNPLGYGHIYVHERASKVGAHRVAWILAHGEIPQGQEVCHTCDNPACVKPSHLFLATHHENMLDMAKKGRAADRNGEKGQRAKLTEAQAVEIVLRRKSGELGTTLAKEFGVSPTAVYALACGASWRNVPAVVRALKGGEG